MLTRCKQQSSRGGVYRSEVEKARNALLAQGKHPSVDAVRVALGNTGSKTTIHRHLKEIEAEDTQGVGGKFPISDALADLVSRLAGQLNAEADQRIADVQARCDEQLRDRATALEQARQDGTALTAQLRQAEEALQAEKGAHQTVQSQLVVATTTIRQLEERTTGLTVRLSEHEAHAQSLEQKHTHAREALEHYRTSVKEQRDQEQRRHEHQVQQLQVDLREARDALTGKNQELLQLNRDNVRLLEQVSQAQRATNTLEHERQKALTELHELRPLPTAMKSLETHTAALMAQLDGANEERDSAIAAAQTALEALRESELQVARITSRLETLEDITTKRANAAPASVEK